MESELLKQKKTLTDACLAFQDLLFETENGLTFSLTKDGYTVKIDIQPKKNDGYVDNGSWWRVK